MSNKPGIDPAQQVSISNSNVVPLKSVQSESSFAPEQKPIEALLATIPSWLNDTLEMMNQKMGALQSENQGLRQEISEHKNAVQGNTEQVNRLGNTVAQLATKFNEKVVTGKNPDLVISPHGDPSLADVALVDSALPAEAVYPYTTGELASWAGIHASRLGQLFKKAGIQGDHNFHCAIKTGKTNVVHKYKARALRGLYDFAVVHGAEAGIKPKDIALIARAVGMIQSFTVK